MERSQTQHLDPPILASQRCTPRPLQKPPHRGPLLGEKAPNTYTGYDPVRDATFPSLTVTHISHRNQQHGCVVECDCLSLSRFTRGPARTLLRT